MPTSNFHPATISSTNPTDGDTHNFNPSYATSHDAATSAQARPDDGAGGGAHYAGQFLTGGNYHIYRSYDCFDTSALGAGATITAATITWKIADVGTADSFNLNVYSVTMNSTSTIITSDFNKTNFGSTSFGSFASSSLGGIGTTFTITLNASGIAAINKTGITTFGYRTDNDVSSTSPSGSQYVACYVYSNASSAGNPVLSVTYTLPNSNFLMFMPN